MKVVTRNDWKNHPMPEEIQVLSVEQCFSLEEMRLIRQGFHPQAMEHRWFIYCEDDRLYIHRSWSGHCIFEVIFVAVGDAYCVNSLTVNRDQGQYYALFSRYRSDTQDVELFLRIVSNYLLEKPEVDKSIW